MSGSEPLDSPPTVAHSELYTAGRSAESEVIQMARKPAKMYRQIKGQAFTRRQYTGGVPNNRILRYFMGNRVKAEAGEFPVRLELTADNPCQIRDSALEAARQVANATIRTAAGEQYALRMHTYPHQILRENKQATGAGADRVSQGMRLSFGKNVGTAARVQRNQVVVSIVTQPEFYVQARDALRKATCKFPTPCTIHVAEGTEHLRAKGLI